MIFRLSGLLIGMLLTVNVVAQSIVGNWSLYSTEFSATDGQSEHGVTPETCLWRDLVSGESELLIRQSGSVEFTIDRLATSKSYLLKNDQFILSMENQAGRVSSITYQWSTQGSNLILERSDKLVKERYVFVRS